MNGLFGWIGEWGNKRFIFYAGLSLSFLIFIIFYPNATASALQTETESLQLTPTSGVTAMPTPSSTPELQGQVGANAGLVCGAGVLVIIIIAGLMWSARWMQTRGREVDREGEET